MRHEENPVFLAVQPIVLASASPRRRELLAGLGLTFTIRVVDGAEPDYMSDDIPEEYVMRAATAKAVAVAQVLAEEFIGSSMPVVLGADTVVVLHETGGPVILGKPASQEEALAMLLNLAGREHTVYTGCCLVWPAHGVVSERLECFCDATRVSFAPWSEEVLRAYVNAGESLDKAGGYAIQGKGAFLTSRIDGLWSTVVGLPVWPLADRLLRHGVIRPA